MKVLVAGDYCPIERVDELINKGDFASVFSPVKKVVAHSDYSIVNLECPVLTRDARPIVKQGPNLKCSRKGVDALKWVGFKCVTLANNHFLDYGQRGVQDTLETLDSLGVDHVGGGMNLRDSSMILYKQIDGKTLAIINCCEHEFSIATASSAGSNPLNPVLQYKAIKEARDKADHVLVIVHGGHEHFQLPSPRMVDTYRFFVEAGADAVVNHHQHCFSGYEVWEGKPIFYGLGNFCFDNAYYREGNWTEGYCVIIDFSKSRPTFSIQPYIQCGKEPKIVMQPAQSLDEKLEKLNNTIADHDALKYAIEDYYESTSAVYGNIFEPLYNRLYLAAKHRGWLPSLISKKRILAAFNFVMCEAHRDKLIWWMNHNK